MDGAATVHVVDDDEAVRDSLRFLLGAEGLAVRTYASAAALLGAELLAAGCVLTDFHMPGMDGLKLQARLAESGVTLPVIVMTGYGDVPAAVRAMKAGAIDFLEKPFADGQLMDAIGRALQRGRQAMQDRAQAETAAVRIGALTPRERQVLDLLAAGSSTKEIARALGTSPRTIDVHRARVLHKLGVESLPDLVRLVLAAKRAP
jgi:two-component system response regulator FixJ